MALQMTLCRSCSLASMVWERENMMFDQNQPAPAPAGAQGEHGPLVAALIAALAQADPDALDALLAQGAPAPVAPATPQQSPLMNAFAAQPARTQF